MKSYTLYLLLFLLSACASNKENESAQSEPSHSEHTLIRDNLYTDQEGNLYLKSVNNEDIHHKYDVWIETVYCDTCFTPTEDGFKDITTLKDFVDPTTFHLDSTDGKQGGHFYKDKNHRYFHKWMADGGTITVY